MKNKKKSNNKGEVMLESLVVYTITIFLLFFILALFSALYQRWNIQTIANESAMRYAQTYRFNDKDVSSGYVDESQLIMVKDYRYFGGNNTDLETSAKNEIKNYAKNRLKKTSYTIDLVEPKIDVKISKDDVSRRHIEVSIEGEYKVPFNEALNYFGFGSSLKYKTVAYAECIDLIDYIETTDFVNDKLSSNFFNSGIVKCIDSVLKLWSNITS